jgi:excisionase family DNA binding protein
VEEMEEMEDKVYTVREFAKVMKISESYAYLLVRKGKVRSVKFGDRYLVPARVIDQILAGDNQLNNGTVS